MYILERIFESRVWIFAVAIIVHGIGIAVIEAHNSASRIAVLVISSVWLILSHIYAAYIGYRLWSRLSLHSLSVGLLPTTVFPLHKSKRDSHSLWVWIDMYIALTIAWAFWSQSVKLMWEDTFHTEHASHNDWVAMFQWWTALARVAVGEDQPYEAIHPATVAIYVIPTILFKIYDITVLAIGIAHVWEHINARRKQQQQAGLDSETSSGSREQQQQQKHRQVARVAISASAAPASACDPPDPFGGAVPPSIQAPFWDPHCADELAFAKYLNNNYHNHQQSGGGSRCARMDPDAGTVGVWIGGGGPMSCQRVTHRAPWRTSCACERMCKTLAHAW